MVIVHEGGHGADLDRVGVIGRVLKQTIIRVEQLPGNQEEELPGRPAVVQPATRCNKHPLVLVINIGQTAGSDTICDARSPFFPYKADVELAALQVFTRVAHDLVEGIFQQVVAADDQPEAQTDDTRQHHEKVQIKKPPASDKHILPTSASRVLGRSLWFPASCRSCAVWPQSLFCRVLGLWHSLSEYLQEGGKQRNTHPRAGFL